MKKAVSLASYCGRNWAEHLQQADFHRAMDEDKLVIGTNVARMMCDKELFPEWAGYRTYLYFNESFAKPMLPWLRESMTSGRLDSEASTQLGRINESNSLDIVEPVLRYYAQCWLAPIIGVEYSVSVVPTLVYSWQARKRGESVQVLPELTRERIMGVAKWANLEENAEWHRRIAMTFRDFELWDEAKEHFGKALELESGM